MLHSEKLTNLRQIRSVLLETKSRIAGVADAAADAMDELAAQAVTMDQVHEAIQSAIGLPAGPPDPVVFYQKTRGADWLPVPEPADNEIYLLLHIPDGVSSLLAFTVTCSGNYTVEWGTECVAMASGTKFETELFANDFDSVTVDGLKQAIVKISGSDILTWEPSVHSKKSKPARFAQWNIREIKCRLPSCTAIKAGGTAALTQLKYFSMYGPSQITNMSGMFNGCCSLTAVPQLNTAGVTNMNNMFYGCKSLAALPQLDTAGVTDMSRMFYNCSALTSLPQLNTANVTNMSSMFYNCSALTSLPQLDTANVTDMSSMFQNCGSLTAVPPLNSAKALNMSYMFHTCSALLSAPPLNTAKATDMSYMFANCSALTVIPPLSTAAVTNMNNAFYNCSLLGKVRLVPDAGEWAGCAISFSNCSMGHTALKDLLHSLPAVTAEKILTLTGNPGTSELTDEEKAVAEEKNWTLKI